VIVDAGCNPPLFGGTGGTEPSSVHILRTHGTHMVGAMRASHALRLVM
jgi:hypothetical protein